MNKWLRLSISFVAFLICLAIFAFAATGNWVFDRLYLWEPNFQPSFILIGLFVFPYYVRYVINVIKQK